MNRLKFVAPIQNARTDLRSVDLNYLALEHIESGTGRILDISTTLEVDSVVSLFSRNDILFSKLRPYLAKVVHANFDGACTSELLVLRPNDLLIPRYLFFYLLSDRVISVVNSFAYGSKMPRASWEQLANLPIPIASTTEQQTIADFLDQQTAIIDTLIAKKQELIWRLHKKRTALISHAVTKGLDPTAPMRDSGIEWLGDIPAHWEMLKLKYIGSALVGLTYSPDDVVDEGEGTLVLRASNIQNAEIVFQDNVYVDTIIPDKLRTVIDDILICSRSGSRSLIGKNALIDERSAGLSFGAFMTIFRSEFSQYLFYVFNSTLFEFQSSSFLTSTINQLTLGDLNNLLVPFPPMAEQGEITEFLKRRLKVLRELEKKAEQAIDMLKEYRNALISAAVTGKIDVRVHGQGDS